MATIVPSTTKPHSRRTSCAGAGCVWAAARTSCRGCTCWHGCPPLIDSIAEAGLERRRCQLPAPWRRWFIWACARGRRHGGRLHGRGVPVPVPRVVGVDARAGLVQGGVEQLLAAELEQRRLQDVL